MNFHAFTFGDATTCPLVDYRRTAMNARPGQDGSFAVVAVDPTTELRLEASESGEFLNGDEFDCLYPRSDQNATEDRVLGDTGSDLSPHLGRHDTAATDDKFLQYVDSSRP